MIEERVFSIVGDTSVEVESIEGFDAATLAFAAATTGKAAAEVITALFT